LPSLALDLNSPTAFQLFSVLGDLLFDVLISIIKLLKPEEVVHPLYRLFRLPVQVADLPSQGLIRLEYLREVSAHGGFLLHILQV